MSNFILKKSDIVSIRSGGGGGWGDPLERDPQLVLEDYKDGLISLETANKSYGIIINLEKLIVDLEATKKLKEEMRRKRNEELSSY